MTDNNTQNIAKGAKEGIDRYYEVFRQYPKTVIDIGAHVGGCACYAIERKADFVIAIEADKDNFMQLIINEKIIKPHDTTFFPVYAAFSHSSNRVTSLIIPNNSNTGQRSLCFSCNAIAVRDGYKIQTVETVNLSRIDLYLDILNIKAIDYFKIDIEGAEFRALPMNDTTARFFDKVKFIDIELHSWANSNYYDINQFYIQHPEFNKKENIIKQYLCFLHNCGFELGGINFAVDYNGFKLMTYKR